jgi:hypothetical protein
MDLENRIAVLERDVHAIKSELAVIRRDHNDAKQLSARVGRVELDLVEVKHELAQIRKDVSQLTADVLRLKEAVKLIRVDLARLQGDDATKADVGNLKGWTIGIALTLLSLNLGMNAIIYNALQKTTAAPKPAQALHATPPQNGRSLVNN